MKICILAAEFLPVLGGAGTYTVELIRHLPSEFEVYVVTLKRRIPGNKQLSEDLLREYFGDNVVIDYVTDARETFLYNANFQHKCYRYVPHLYKQHKFDVVHSQHVHMADLWLKLRGRKLPYLTTVHVTFAGERQGMSRSRIPFKDLEHSEKYQWLLYPALRALEYLYLKRSPRLIAVSHWMKKILMEEFGLPPYAIDTVHNGVDPKLYRPKCRKSEFIQKIEERSGGPIVLFTGRMRSTKGINILIRSMPKVIEEVRDVRFIFAGSGFSDPYKRQIRIMRISERNYEFLGYVPQKDMPALYSIASIYPTPTLYENLPIRILEAMSTQIPVIASNICGIPEIITDGEDGILVPTWDIEALSNRIIELLTDRRRASKIGKNARKTIEQKFTWQYATEKTVKVYKEIAGCVTS